MKTLNKEDLKQRWHPKFKFGLGLTGETLDPIIDKFYGGVECGHKVEFVHLRNIRDINWNIFRFEIYENINRK